MSDLPNTILLQFKSRARVGSKTSAASKARLASLVRPGPVTIVAHRLDGAPLATAACPARQRLLGKVVDSRPLDFRSAAGASLFALVPGEHALITADGRDLATIEPGDDDELRLRLAGVPKAAEFVAQPARLLTWGARRYLSARQYLRVEFRDADNRPALRVTRRRAALRADFADLDWRVAAGVTVVVGSLQRS